MCKTVTSFFLLVVFVSGFDKAEGLADGDLRLVDGRTNHSGRVEIYRSLKWGTICDDGFSINDARVVCTQLGFSDARPQVWRSVPAGFGRILLDDVHCVGNEQMLMECRHRAWGQHNCRHTDDVGVECYGKPLGDDMRLVGGTERSGRLEVNDGGRWGLICSHGFDQYEAVVACRTLGFELAFMWYMVCRVWILIRSDILDNRPFPE